MSRLRALWQLVLTRWRNLYREPETIFWAFVFPLVVAMALGVAFRDRRPDPAMIGVEAGPGAEALADTLAKRDELKPRVLAASAGLAELRSGKLDMLVAPGPPPIYRFDASRPEGRTARMLVDDALQRAAGRVDPAPAIERRITERGSRYIDFLMPGLVGMGLMQNSLWGVAYPIAEMRTRRLLQWFKATPMRRGDFLISFVLVRALVLSFELPSMLAFGAVAFDVPIYGSLPLLAAVAVLGALVFASLGLVVVSRARTLPSVNGLLNLASTPMFIVSGTFFSAARFPDAVRPFIGALPLTALNDALRAVMLDGASVSGIARELGILLAWGVVSLVGAIRLFRWH